MRISISSPADKDFRTAVSLSPAAQQYSIAHPLGFQAENGFGLVSVFLCPEGLPRGRARAPSPPAEALLIAAEAIGRVAETTCDIVLICYPTQKQNHGVAKAVRSLME